MLISSNRFARCDGRPRGTDDTATGRCSGTDEERKKAPDRSFRYRIRCRVRNLARLTRRLRRGALIGLDPIVDRPRCLFPAHATPCHQDIHDGLAVDLRRNGAALMN